MKLRINVAVIIEVPDDLGFLNWFGAGCEWAGKNLPLTDAKDWSTTEVERSEDGCLP